MADGAGEREQFPAWAKEHDVVAEIEQGGVKHKVPPSVRDRLNAPRDGRVELCFSRLSRAPLVYVVC